MKIVICVHNLANGGAERVAALLATGFAERGDEVTTIIADKNALVEYEISDKVRIVNIYAEGNAIMRYSKKIINLRKCIKDIKPDVAIAVMPPFDLWLLLATFGTKTKIVDTVHFSLERPKTNPISRKLRFHTFYLSRLFDAVTVLTEADLKVIKKKVKNSFAMPNPISFVPKYNAEAKERVILASGRLDGWYVKGFDVLIKSWSKIHDKYPDWKVQIAGRGDKNSEHFLKELAKENDVENRVEFLGFRPNIKDDYYRSSVFVLSSRTEGFSMVLLEAMSQGCACISCSYKGRQEEIITNDDEGIICQPEDIEGVARALEKVISDEILQKKMQEGAYKRSYAFEINNIVMKWNKIFEFIGLGG